MRLGKVKLRKGNLLPKFGCLAYGRMCPDILALEPQSCPSYGLDVKLPRIIINSNISHVFVCACEKYNTVEDHNEFHYN